MHRVDKRLPITSISAVTQTNQRKLKMKPKSRIPDEERPTEDDIARKNLGGTKGDGSEDAPMTEQRRKKTPSNDDPGHTA